MNQPSESFRFHPAWWARGKHLQTLAGRVLRPLDRGPFRSDRIELPDGDFVDLHEWPYALPRDAPIALVLHGLEGSSRANYVASLARELAAVGIRAVRMNFRACSGEPNRLPRFYHAGDTGDLHQVVRHLRDREPATPIGAVGFSLGGNVLLKYLGEREMDAGEDLQAAAAISVPFDLAAGTRRLEEAGMSRLYTTYFIRKLRRKAIGKREALADHCDIDLAIAARTVREYDEALTARLHGFRDAWHYYESSSSSRWLERIRLPTLVLHSLDDPFLPKEHVPMEVIRANPCLIDAVNPRGGHVGFVAGTPWRPVFWAERTVARFLAERLSSSGPTAERRSPVADGMLTDPG
jgi:uncharacterized protein